MPQYIFVYLGGEQPANARLAQEHMNKYHDWMMGLGDAVVAPAIPFKDTHVVSQGSQPQPGTMSQMSGISILRFANGDEALAAAQACPFLEIGGSLEISEMIEMSQQPDPGGSGKPN